jgi:hypothetical protein
VFPNIKHYILNSVPSKLALLELIVVSVAIDHQMVMIRVQIGNNFIEDVLLDGGFGVDIITE